MASQKAEEDELTRELLNYATRIGTQAKLDGVDRSQMEHLIASLDSIEHEKYCLLATAAFASRQASRLGRGTRLAKTVAQAMSYLYQRGKGREEARRMLGLAKWIYESSQRIRLPSEGVSSLDDFVRILAEVRF